MTYIRGRAHQEPGILGLCRVKAAETHTPYERNSESTSISCVIEFELRVNSPFQVSSTHQAWSYLVWCPWSATEDSILPWYILLIWGTFVKFQKIRRRLPFEMKIHFWYIRDFLKKQMCFLLWNCSQLIEGRIRSVMNARVDLCRWIKTPPQRIVSTFNHHLSET